MAKAETKGPQGIIRKKDLEELETLTTKIPASLKETILEMAEKEGVSPSYYLRRILEDVVSGEYKNWK